MSSMHALLLAAALFAARPAELSRIEKMGRILELEDRRSVGEGELGSYLSDTDRSVRRRAALAAGRIGDPALVPALVERMNDQEAEVRQMAAFALGLIGQPAAAERLVAALGDPEPVVRARAAEALGRVGGALAAPALTRFVLDSLPGQAPQLSVRGDDPGSASDPWLPQRLALFALARLGDVSAAEQALLNAGRSRFDWWAATWTAAHIGSPRLAPVLVAAAASSDPLSRALAAQGLGALEASAALDRLAELSRDPEPLVAAQAVRAIGAIGDARGIPAIAAALRSSSSPLVVEALHAVAALPVAASLRPQVVDLVGHEEAWVRAAALQALAHIDREQFALVLSGMDRDRSWSVRAALAGALAESGDEISLGILFTLLRDEDTRVLPAALRAIRQVRGADALPTLEQHLAHADPAVRAAAAEGIAALQAGGVSGALEAAYRRGLPDPQPVARLAAVSALAVQKDAKAVEVLREIAGADPVRAVRVRAGAALAALGQQAPWPGFERPSRPTLDYREAMRPYDPLPGVPLYTPRVILHTRRGDVEIHLNVVEAPLSCLSFLELARGGFFTGLGVQSVVPGGVVRGGDPRGDGSGGPGYTLRDEVGQRPFGRGGVGLVRREKDTAGSQFLISLSPQPQLDGEATLVGWVAEGMDVVDQLRPGDLIERVEVWTGQ